VFDVVNEVPIDDQDETFLPGQEADSTIRDCCIDWKGDSKLLFCNYQINGGFKCLTRDTSLNVVKGPARSDNNANGRNVVVSVSERVTTSLQRPVGCMPSGSLITGFSIRETIGKKMVHELVLWEKNGLRHGEIPLPDYGNSKPIVKAVKWNIDSSLLAAHIQVQD
jgi:hypothetical protein